MLKNKRGDIVAIIWIIGILFLLLIIGVGLAFGGMVIDWTFDEAMPELTTIGMVGNSNVSQATGYALNPINNVVQSFTWLGGIFYLLGIFGAFGLAFAFRFSGDKYLMGFFIACMLMLVLASIFMSNIYQDFYDGSDDVSTRLHEQVMLSFLILNSPIIMCVIGFMCGIIMFTGETDERI